MKVRFIEVGRGKKTFELEVPNLDPEHLEKALRRGTRIASSVIEFTLDEGSLASGEVVVGGFRAIGRWEALP